MRWLNLSSRDFDLIGFGAAAALFVRDLVDGNVVGPAILALAALFFLWSALDKKGTVI